MFSCCGTDPINSVQDKPDLVTAFVQPIVKKIYETVLFLIKEEFHAFHGVKKDVEKLLETLKTIQDGLQDADEKQHNDQLVRSWLQNLQTVAYDADDTLDTLVTETFLRKREQQVRKIQGPTCVSNERFKFRFAQKIQEILKEFDAISEEQIKYNLNAYTEGRSQGTRSSRDDKPPEDDKNVFGRDSDRDRLVDLLLSNESDREGGNVSVIPIVGMGGIGKTTLAQYIFNNNKVKKHFKLRMWVSVTVEFDVRRILKEIVEFHSKMKYPDDVSQTLLESRFIDIVSWKKKRFLIVLDDVWTEDYNKWESLQNVLKRGNKGSKVLVTTRNPQVSNMVTKQSPHVLEPLADDACWSLFETNAFIDGDDSLTWGQRKEFEGIGRKIVGRCQGLPLAVEAMARLLRFCHDRTKWEQILKRSRSPNILPILRLSYDYLSSYLKQCFAYCSVFPKAYVFDKEELVKLWMAEGFIQPIGEDNLEEKGIEYFDELLMRSFFQILSIDGKVRYRMHDLYHDLAVSVSSTLCCQVKENESNDLSEESRHISLLTQYDVENLGMEIIRKSKKLRTLLLPGESLKSFGKALDKMFHSLQCIRVLDLSSSSLSELPTSIGKLKLLRYLDVSRTEIKVLPNSICNLYNLQTLKLLGCIWLFELPEGICNLVNLRHLELDEMFWFKCRMLPPRMGNLTSLQNLPAFRVSDRSGYGIEQLKNMANLTGTLHISKLESVMNAADAKLKEKKSLRKLVLEWTDKDFNQEDEDRAAGNLEGLRPHSNLEELAVLHFKSSSFPSWATDGALQNLVKLTLNHCTKWTTISIGQLPCLQELYLKGMQELEEWPEDQCPVLGKLQISDCPRLRKLPTLMQNLRVMIMKNCSSLTTLPMAPFLAFLVLVDNHVLEDWKEGCCIARDHQGKLVEGPPRPTFIGLLELKIINCPKIQALPRIFGPQTLEISGCGPITSLPAPKLAQRLQHLALDKCSNGTLVRAIPSTKSLHTLVISNISNLTTVPKLNHLPRLNYLYISDCEDLTSLSEEEGSLSSLKLLSVRGCPKLESLPDEGLPTTLDCLMIDLCPILKSLDSNETLLKSPLPLKDLYLENCPLIQSLPRAWAYDLVHLVIHNCPGLIQDCRQTEWSKIKHVADLEIDSM